MILVPRFLLHLSMNDFKVKKDFILKAIEEVRKNLSQLLPEQVETFKKLDETAKKESFEDLHKVSLMLMMIDLAKLKQFIIKKMERVA